MDEQRYQELVRDAFARITRAFDDVDPDQADLDSAGDVISIVCRDGVKLVLNTQRPTRQIWLAGHARAWHFDWDEASGTWRDPRRGDAELFATLRELVREHAGLGLEGL